MQFHFRKLLYPFGWLENAVVEVDEKGIVTSIETAGNSVAGSPSGYALPGFRNCHSHAFQYAMAGSAERHDPSNSHDDFWGWRERMYRLANTIGPEEMEAVAAMLYSELVRHGFTHVAEFHYLHHDQDGRHYSNPVEMGERLIAAAETAGINITLVPVFYRKGGFDKDALREQRRFISQSVDDYASLLDATADICSQSEIASTGVGIHSLRAVTAEDVKVAASIHGNLPFHIHISEQEKEVEECLANLGSRPVRWMLENIDVSDRFNFVHATHTDSDEISGMATAGVSVVLCPSTEGNLGDGIFPLGEFQAAGGSWSIGTDSHVCLSPFEELRLLDYGQRLTTHNRKTFVGAARSSASNAIKQTTSAGRNATGEFGGEYFQIGRPLNACVIKGSHPLLRTASDEELLDRIVYASDSSFIEGTIVNGRWKARDGSHLRFEEIANRYVRAMKTLG